MQLLHVYCENCPEPPHAPGAQVPQLLPWQDSLTTKHQGPPGSLSGLPQ
jgi:hypothetical protein